MQTRPSKPGTPRADAAADLFPYADMFASLADAEPAADLPPATQAAGREHAEPESGADVSRQILAHLEKHGLAASSRLRIEVHGGVVVVAGEVPTTYEKQLVAHFCRQLPAVVKFVDAMTVRPPQEPAGRRSAPRPRAKRHSREWEVPFRAWHAGAALAFVVVVGSALSFGRGQGPDRLEVHPLTGELQFDGEPAAGAWISLHPLDPAISVRPRASVDADGTFAITTYESGDGAPAGKYRATVEWRRPVAGQGDEDVPPNVLPAAYANPKTSPVEVTVTAGDNEFPQITFQR